MVCNSDNHEPMICVFCKKIFEWLAVHDGNEGVCAECKETFEV